MLSKITAAFRPSHASQSTESSSKMLPPVARLPVTVNSLGEQAVSTPKSMLRPASMAPPMVTPVHKTVVPRFDCGAGAFQDGIWPISEFDLATATYRTVPLNAITAAINAVAAQDTFGINASWSCGPNSAARCAAMFSNPIRNMGWFIDNCPRTSGLNWGIPEPWPKVGPHPDMLASFLGGIDEFREREVRSFAHRTDDWGAMWNSLERHINAGRPVILMLSSQKARQHYVCLVGIDTTQQQVVILDTSQELFAMPIDTLRQKMDAWDTWGRIGDVFAKYNSVHFEPYHELRQQQWRVKGGGGNCIVM